jgi:AraC-like DNA-binding protein
MAVEQVRMWRPADEDRVLLMAGRTTRYAMTPRGEFVFGVVAEHPMRSVRGRERRLVLPGQLVAWDPSRAHSGTAVDGRAWRSLLMVVEVGDLLALAAEDARDPLAGLRLGQPVIDDRRLARDFVRLHRAFEGPATRLERDERLAAWLRVLVGRASPERPARRPLRGADRRALARASELLAAAPERNLGLDELALAAGISKFRLVRLFRERTGLPPHALQVAHRIRRARRLLEQGAGIAETAAAVGFADQSHLHHHFRRSLGLTPAEYRRRCRPG